MIIALDQFSKYLVSTNMSLNQNIPVLKNFFELTFVKNTGAAFSSFQNSRYFFITATIIIIIVLVYFLYKKKFVKNITNIGVCLIIGGGIGNLIDRIFLGYVVDFIDFIAIYFVCPAIFNIADMFVFLGTVIFAVSIIWIEPSGKVGNKDRNTNIIG